jgi:hypothetical protein
MPIDLINSFVVDNVEACDHHRRPSPRQRA